ncbi:hypothetical protein PRZ48_003117 [Zasmidium cellare]|uniref:SnoaL-like domain-containing protein n=1 Tax=Zasmidium cellare TaxID=395010 RepID=A0ABR0EUR8_ZASCE|nr:hypothetical protein PRZ48_003117 [Zasmidium cellare]
MFSVLRPSTVSHDPDKTAARLKEICDSYIEGLNVRDFDPNSPRWRSTLAPNFRLLVTSDAMYEHLTPATEAAAENTKDLDITAMCDVLRQSARENPSWHSRLVDAAVTVYKDEKAEFMKQGPQADAEVWCSCEHSGVPEGVTRSAMWVGYFAVLNGDWRLVGARHVSGMGSPDFI